MVSLIKVRSIRRVVFYSLIKPTVNEKGEKEMDTISVSQALQIAGRAGRYGTQFDMGYVTTFKPEDLSTLQSLLSQQPEPIIKAGLHPTAEQIELYAYHLPNSTLSNLMDIFVTLSTVDDSLYFMCNIEDFKFLADMIQHVPLPLRARYVFCCAPINKKMPFVCTMFLKFARQYSRNQALTFDWLCRNIGWPFTLPKTIIDLVHLEAVFDVLDLYLWFSYRFMDLFPEANLVRDMQKELDAIIQQGVFQLTRLLRNSETAVSSGTMSVDDDEFAIQQQKQTYLRGSAGTGPNQPCSSPVTGSVVTGSELTCSSSLCHRQRWNRFGANFLVSLSQTALEQVRSNLVPLCSRGILEQSYSGMDFCEQSHKCSLSVLPHIQRMNPPNFKLILAMPWVPRQPAIAYMIPCRLRPQQKTMLCARRPRDWSRAGEVFPYLSNNLSWKDETWQEDNKLVERSPIGRGKLTERLLAQGLLTPNMLHELRQEWKMRSSSPSGKLSRCYLGVAMSTHSTILLDKEHPGGRGKKNPLVPTELGQLLEGEDI
uniref:(California timema) hypothetical protein n=1 Tax=Timema californicum TaxID=61474 RepID=A0A7R9P9Q8_TIMCA|nr:unnamed protein product [Timema californicum]